MPPTPPRCNMTLPVAHERLIRSAGVVILAVRPPYHLIRTLQCGQAFRWRVDGARAAGRFSGRPVGLEPTARGVAGPGAPPRKGPFGPAPSAWPPRTLSPPSALV